ncbi:phage holin family protein [Aquabacterium sp.]|uniref:phage holin family protein n=1 Tax=Aquabacterium sp. TaxID=1872578 RepID=UPI003D6D5C46
MIDSTNPTAPPSGGLLASTRGLLATLLEIFHTRLELLSTELEEEKLRLLKVLAWGAVALMFGGMGFLFLSTFVVVLFWDEHRLLAVGAMAALFMLACAVAVARVGVHWQASTALLAATLAELKHDQQALMSSSSDAGEA